MDYVVDEQSPRFNSRLSFFPLRLRFGSLPRLVTRLREGGYDFYHGASRWTPCVVRAEILCLSDRGDAGFSAHVAGVFLSPTKIPLDRLGLLPEPAAGGLATLGSVIGGLKSRGRPFFAFVHELSPHPPFRVADCSQAPIDQPLTSRVGAVARREYVHSIECVNAEMESQTQRILAQDPDAIVVFQADHGSDFEVDWKRPMTEWTAEAIDERSSVLNLVRLPPACASWLRPNLSPVNTMRLVIGCLEGRPPDYLADRTFLNNYESSPGFGSVRDVSTVAK